LQAAAEPKDLSRGLVQSLGFCFYPHLKCLKRFILLLPDAAVRVAEDLRTRSDVSASVFLLLFDSFGDGMEVHLTE
jgi:hypothetical protein